MRSLLLTCYTLRASSLISRKLELPCRQMNPSESGYWYLASYPKSGNTWCRIFITELQRLSDDNQSKKQLDLNEDIKKTGVIASSRHWLDDQLGINSCDLSFGELDPLRGRAGESNLIFEESERFHKVHDAFTSPDSKHRPVVSVMNCKGVVYISRHPEDVAVSLSHYYDLSVSKCVQTLIDSDAALLPMDHAGDHQVRQHMGRWDQHVNSWLDQTCLPILSIRYEDMLTDSFSTFSSLVQFLELPSDPVLINKAIKNTSIGKLQELETEVGGFRAKPKTCQKFFRSGRSGEGAEQLSIQQRHLLFSVLENGMKRLGYEGPSNTAEEMI